MFNKLVNFIHDTHLIISNNFYCGEIKIDFIISELKNKNIIIYGYGSAGRKIGNSLRYFNIHIDCYVDKNNKEIQNIDNEYNIYGIEYLGNIDIKNYYIIIAVNTYDVYNSILGDINYRYKNVFLINGFELNFILNYYICRLKLEKGTEHKISECIMCRFLDNNCGILREFAKIQNINNFLSNNKLSKRFSSFTYLVTNKCTLKCRDCSISIPYMPFNADIDMNIILSDINKISRNSLFIDYIILMGGELLLHKKIDVLLEKILEIKNIGFLSLWSTATYIPNDNFFEIIIKNKKRIHFNISDYGKNVPEILINIRNKFIEKLNVYNIDYVVLKNKAWFNLSEFNLNNKDMTFLRSYYKKCSMAKKTCVEVQNGKIYRCGPHFSGIISNKIEEYNVLDINSIDEKELPNALDSFMEMEYIEACKYCVLPSDNLKIIDAAIQVNRTEQNRTEQNRTEQNRTEQL